MPLTKFVTKTVNSWDDLRNYLAKFDHNWAFRGVSTASWGLQNSLERLNVSLIVDAERYLLTTFQRRAHHYVRDCPALEDYLEWLALMQHYGTPTRLLDFTRSPYIALFFAMQNATSTGANAAVWAVNLHDCKWAAVNLLKPQNSTQNLEADISLGKPELFRELFMREHDPGPIPAPACVAPIQPFRMNERLIIQQGLFLCPSSVQISFEDNLQP